MYRTKPKGKRQLAREARMICLRSEAEELLAGWIEGQPQRRVRKELRRELVYMARHPEDYAGERIRPMLLGKHVSQVLALKNSMRRAVLNIPNLGVDNIVAMSSEIAVDPELFQLAITHRGLRSSTRELILVMYTRAKAVGWSNPSFARRELGTAASDPLVRMVAMLCSVLGESWSIYDLYSLVERLEMRGREACEVFTTLFVDRIERGPSPYESYLPSSSWRSSWARGVVDDSVAIVDVLRAQGSFPSAVAN